MYIASIHRVYPRVSHSHKLSSPPANVSSTNQSDKSCKCAFEQFTSFASFAFAVPLGITQFNCDIRVLNEW
ncbi:hypothetical protein CY34DRAFT_813905 [Suillus luteus UH-Slu-Lm8-n1]|uniref:Uncharacterized protein n=1 Tax=Suillus luteus UH-Slu-Lm8-n1 TaxID=930992 RepID=A0A0C9ZUJ7_9AGAM|nr:hypothetical protein CY34DRAFT_813905 [Suillus luteus UH-Slu-Lm8-n1]